MPRASWSQLRDQRLAAATPNERLEHDVVYRAAALAADVGDQIRTAREAAGLTQRQLAANMNTSQAAIARLEAGGVGAIITTFQKVAEVLSCCLTVRLDCPSG